MKYIKKHPINENQMDRVHSEFISRQDKLKNR